jgi:hypothetical protein
LCCSLPGLSSRALEWLEAAWVRLGTIWRGRYRIGAEGEDLFANLGDRPALMATGPRSTVRTLYVGLTFRSSMRLQRGPRYMPFAFAAIASLAAGCAQSALPSLPSAVNAPVSAEDTVSGQTIETAIIVPGTPTDIYALVARGALRCWLGPDGPLHATHVFEADAQPPSDGGLAHIIIHERDPTMGDQRGVQAFKVSFDIAPGGTRVVTTPIKMPEQTAPLMVRDVQAWARGETNCQAIAAAPQQPATPATPATQAKPTGARR